MYYLRFWFVIRIIRFEFAKMYDERVKSSENWESIEVSVSEHETLMRMDRNIDKENE